MAGRLSSEALQDFLLGAQGFLPVPDEVEPLLDIQRSTKARPLVLHAEDGTPVWFVFSNPDRARPFIRDFPEYGGGILVEFPWILEHLGSGRAIALDLGSELGFAREAEIVARLAQDRAGRQQS